MKLLRIFGGLLFALGCVAALIGLAALLLPMVENDQLKLVLASFETPSDNAVVSMINTVMSYALHNCYIVMLAGAGSLMLGVVIMLLGKSPAKPEAAVAESTEDAGAQAYTVASPDASTDDIPVWKQGGKIAEKANPFADVAKDMLKPSANGSVTETTTNPFAPPGDADIKNSSAYKRPDGDSVKQTDKPGRRKPGSNDTASSAGDAEHLFDLIRRYGAEKESDEDVEEDDGFTVTASSRDSAEEPVGEAGLQEAAEGANEGHSEVKREEERERNADYDAIASGAGLEQGLGGSAVGESNRNADFVAAIGAERERGFDAAQGYMPAAEPLYEVKREHAAEAKRVYAAPDARAERVEPYGNTDASRRDIGKARGELSRDIPHPEPYGCQAYYAPRYEASGAMEDISRGAARKQSRDVPYPQSYDSQAYYAPRYEAGGARDMPREAYRSAPREPQRYPSQSAAVRQPPACQPNAPKPRPSSAQPPRPVYRSAEAGRATGEGAMHIPKTIQLPAAYGTEETIYRAPSYRPQGSEGRPRIRSTFPTSRADGATPAAAMDADRTPSAPKPSDGGSRIKSSIGKRDINNAAN